MSSVPSVSQSDAPRATRPGSDPDRRRNRQRQTRARRVPPGRSQPGETDSNRGEQERNDRGDVVRSRIGGCSQSARTFAESCGSATARVPERGRTARQRPRKEEQIREVSSILTAETTASGSVRPYVRSRAGNPDILIRAVEQAFAARESRHDDMTATTVHASTTAAMTRPPRCPRASAYQTPSAAMASAISSPGARGEDRANGERQGAGRSRGTRRRTGKAGSRGDRVEDVDRGPRSPRVCEVPSASRAPARSEPRCLRASQ